MEAEPILVFLPVYDIFTAIPFVCKKWNEIVKSPSFWKHKAFAESKLGYLDTLCIDIDWKQFVIERDPSLKKELVNFQIRSNSRKYNKLKKGEKVTIDWNELVDIKCIDERKPTSSQSSLIYAEIIEKRMKIIKGWRSFLPFFSPSCERLELVCRFILDSIRIIEFKDEIHESSDKDDEKDEEEECEGYESKEAVFNSHIKFISMNGIESYMKIKFYILDEWRLWCENEEDFNNRHGRYRYNHLYRGHVEKYKKEWERERSSTDEKIEIKFGVEGSQDEQVIRATSLSRGDEDDSKILIPKLKDLEKLRNIFSLTENDIELHSLWRLIMILFVSNSKADRLLKTIGDELFPFEELNNKKRKMIDLTNQ